MLFLQFILCFWVCSSFTVSKFPVSSIFIKSTPAGNENPLRIGHGFDIHRLVPNKKLIIAGVQIPHTMGADAHSDGDAVYHRYLQMNFILQFKSILK
jgi:hypothetical protein